MLYQNSNGPIFPEFFSILNLSFYKQKFLSTYKCLSFNESLKKLLACSCRVGFEPTLSVSIVVQVTWLFKDDQTALNNDSIR